MIQRAGLDALAIVMITAFFVGAVVALLGASVLQTFGATSFDVELINAAVLRSLAR